MGRKKSLKSLSKWSKTLLLCPTSSGVGESDEDRSKPRNSQCSVASRHCRQAGQGPCGCRRNGCQERRARCAAAAGVPVTFSSAARGLEANGRASTDFDANKVKAVRAAIEKGTFTVDADAIADKLLSNAQEIISHNSNSH